MYAELSNIIFDEFSKEGWWFAIVGPKSKAALGHELICGSDELMIKGNLVVTFSERATIT